MWHNPVQTHKYLVSETESADQIMARSLEARKEGKPLILHWMKNFGDKSIKVSQLDKFGGRENYIGLWQDFYYLFMTDPFMNTLFDMSEKDTEHSNLVHGERLGEFWLAFMGDGTKYQKMRGGHPLGNIEVTHIRAKGCPMRGALTHKQFTEYQMYTWVGYVCMSCKKRGVEGKERDKIMSWIGYAMRFYAPFQKD